MRILRLTLPALFIFITLLFISCDRGKSAILKATAEEVQKMCPMEIDHVTTLNSCEYIPEKILKYTYTIDLNDEVDLNSYQKIMGEQVVRQMVETMAQDKSKPLQMLSPTFVHCYKNKAGEVLYEITVTPEMYNNPVESKLKTDDEVYSDLEAAAKVLLPTSSPVEIEEGILLVSVKPIRPRTIEYTYQMIDISISDMDMDIFKNTLEPALKEGVKNDPSDQLLKDNNVVFRFIYNDKNNAHMCTVEVTPEDYK